MGFEYIRRGVTNLPSLIRRSFRKFQKDLHTALPGRIDSFDPETQTATVQLTIMRILIKRDGIQEEKVPEPIAKLINVPVVFPRGGGFSLTFPVKRGDECLVVFVERSFDLWRRTGKVSLPGARRFHSYSDGVAFVGFNSQPNLIPDYSANAVELKEDSGGGKITLSPGGDLKIATSSRVSVETSEATVDASDVSVTAPTITLTGATTVNGDLSVNGSLSFSGSGSGGGDVFISGDLEAGKVSSGGIDLQTHSHPGDDEPPNPT